MSISCSERVTQNSQSYKTAYDTMMGSTTPCVKVVNCLGNIILLAVLVIGCMGAAHAFPEAIMGWTIISLGAGYMGMKLLGGNFKKRKVDLISALLVAACIATFGTLGSLGVLQNMHMSYALIGSVVLTALIACSVRICDKHREDKTIGKEMQILV